MRFLLFSTILLAVFQTAPVTGQQIQKPNKEKLWKQIEPFFFPPEKFQNVFGDFRSPLKFYNGESVNSAEEWPARRDEILNRWHEMMGEWPEPITDQTFEFLETTKRENFTQHKVRFRWLPNQTTAGYLLIPDGEGKKPAVIAVFYEPETAIGLDKPHRDFAYQLVKKGYDLHELHALMASRPFLVSGGSSDPHERWKALNHTIAVNKLLGYNNRVAMTNRSEHSPNEESNEQICRFFEYFLGDSIDLTIRLSSR